jgi:hypothetical protein
MQPTPEPYACQCVILGCGMHVTYHSHLCSDIYFLLLMSMFC